MKIKVIIRKSMFLLIALLLICGISSAVMAQNGDEWGIDYQSEFNDLEYFNQESWGSETENTAQIIQDGDNNSAVQRMSKGSANQQYVNQTGDWNNLEQRALGENNFSSIKQNGNRNNSLTVQNGNYNKAFISQIGDSNSAEIKQFSDKSTALIKQSGNNNNAVIIQD